MYLTGIEKATVLLISMKIEQASKVIKQLSTVEIEKIAKCMLNMDIISHEMINSVLLEFNHSSLLKDYSHVFSKNHVISLFRNALGEENSEILLNKINDHKKIISNISYLNTVNSKKLAQLIKLEHPQIIAVILIYLDKIQAVNVLSCFSDKLSSNVIMRIAKFKDLKNFGIHELKNIVDNLLKHFDYSFIDKTGITFVIKLLKLMKNNNKKDIINNILIADAKLAKRIKIELFEFSDLINFSNDYIQKIVSLVTLNKLSIAMSQLDMVIQDKIFNSISTSDSKILKDLCAKNSSTSIDVINTTQKKLLKKIKKFLITI